MEKNISQHGFFSKKKKPQAFYKLYTFSVEVKKSSRIKALQ